MQDKRIGRALEFCEALTRVNYDTAAAAEQVFSAERLFQKIREGVLRSKQAKRDGQRKAQVQGHRRRARERSAAGSFTDAEWKELLSRYSHCCAYCGNASTRLTVDHFIPLCKGGSNDISNIRPACRSCNSIKGSKLVAE